MKYERVLYPSQTAHQRTFSFPYFNQFSHLTTVFNVSLPLYYDRAVAIIGTWQHRFSTEVRLQCKVNIVQVAHVAKVILSLGSNNSKTKPFKYSVIAANNKSPTLKWSQTLSGSRVNQCELPATMVAWNSKNSNLRSIWEKLEYSFTLGNEILLLKENANQWEEHWFW